MIVEVASGFARFLSRFDTERRKESLRVPGGNGRLNTISHELRLGPGGQRL
jgi:hypothetical protein